MAGRGFQNNPEGLKKAISHSRTPEAQAKRIATLKANILIKNQIMQNVKDSLMKQQTGKKDSGTAYYEEFINKFLKVAKNPESRCGQMLSSTIFTPDLLDQLDEESSKTMAKDLDFLRFRVYKDCIEPQKEYILYVGREKVYVICGGRRAGKTIGAAKFLVYRSITPSSPSLYINKTYAMCLGQVHDSIIKEAEKKGLVVTEDNTSLGLITFSNGSTILLKGNADIKSPEVLQGYKFRTIIIDEAQAQKNMTYLVDTILRPTMTDFEDSLMILQGSPPRVPHTYFEAAMNNPHYKQFRFSMYNNPYIKDPDKVIDEVCTEKGITRDSTLIKREYLNIPCYDMEASVFKNYKIYTELPNDFKPNHIAIGVDYGFEDKNAVITLAYNTTTQQAYILEQDKFNKAGSNEIIGRIRLQYEHALKLATKYGFDKNNIMILTDTNQKDLTYELRETYSLPAYCAYKYDKDFAIDSLAEDLRTGRIYSLKGCLTDEFDMTVHPRDDATDAVLPGIDDNQYHPDAVFALLYAYRQYCYDIGKRAGGESTEKKKSKEEIKSRKSTLPPKTYEEIPLLILNDDDDDDDSKDDVVWS